MKVRMLETPKGRLQYLKGETYEFNGPIEEGYARKFIARGWAEPADKAAKDAAREDQDRISAETRARLEQEAKDKADAETKAKANQQQPRQ